MNEHVFEPENQEKEIEFEKAFQQLQNIIALLAKIGFTIPEYCYSKEKIKEYWNNKFAFPIAKEGLDGIRASRSRNGEFRIWFTNGFEDPKNPKRLEITAKLREQGFDVI